MELTKIKDKELLNQTLLLAKKEKHYTHQILLFLIEIDRRKIYSDLKYPNMFKYLTHELLYSEGEAQVRICAMRLMKGNSLASEKIKTGELNLSQAAYLQGAFLH